MKRFTYRAKEQGSGRPLKGTIQAESERMAGKLLLDRGYVPESLKEVGGGIGEKLNKVTAKDRITFTSQFSTLIGAGLPLAQSLRTVAEQTISKPMKAVIEEILVDVEAGRSLGDAFGKHPDVFNNVYMSLIRAGEVSGTLDTSLKRIARQEEKDAKIASSIKGAMAYPIIAVVVIIMVFIYMTVQVVPQVENLYISLDQKLPALTQALVNIKNFIFGFWWLVIILIGVLVVVLGQFKKTTPGIKMSATLKLNLPFVKGLFLLLYNSRFARISQILLSTGVSVLDTLKISGESTNNILVQQSIERATEKVKSGRTLSESIKDQPYIMPLIPQMAAIGEQSGKMDEMLGKAAQVYEDELDEKIAAISTLIEPILMLALAGMAGVLVGGVLFPIYSLVNSIG